MQKYALIVAGGKGKRMGAEIPKQFLELAGKPILMYSIERFYSFDNSIIIIVVLPEDQLGSWSLLLKKYSFNIPHKVTPGGIHRYYSVKNGLSLVSDESLVAVHDGVRPLVSTDTISRCFETAEKSGSAIPVITSADSLRIVSKNGSAPVDRESVRIIQTPQVFNSCILKKAYSREYNPGFTDDSTVLEKSGEPIHLVEGNRENIKITTRQDLIIASALLHSVT